MGAELAYLRVLKKSRKKPEAGDVFVMQLVDERYVFGRVILANLPRGRAPMPGAYLVYIYAQPSDRKEPNRAALCASNLLIPPTFINQLPWSKGLFETVVHWPLEAGDVLPTHCFRRWDGRYLDETGNQLPGETSPCGEWGLASYRIIDDAVGEALGARKAPR